MALYNRLLERGCFPRELPPFFTTASFASAMATGAASGAVPKVTKLARPGAHNLAQAGTLRRRLGYHNPATSHHIAKIIEAEWPFISKHLAKAGLAYSSPVVGKGTAAAARALVPVRDFGQLPEGRAKTRASAKYLLSADVSRFYASIYTHSIPWALHTKRWSKKNRSGGCGNNLDRAFRNGQDGQTLGIPIGPDCSYLIAECILTAVDDHFDKVFGPVRGHRFLDDYELAFGTYSEAQAAMGALQEALGEYELALNPAKTRIIELPDRIEPVWVSELRSFSFRPAGKGQLSDLLRYFDLAYQRAAEYRDAHVLNYALARVAGEPVDTSNWPILQHLTFQALLGEPKTFKPALQLLQHQVATGKSMDPVLLAEVLNRQITVHAPIGHSSEVAWALWAARVHSVVLEQPAADELSRVTDPVLVLLALDCESAGLFAKGALDYKLWLPFMDTPELEGAHWLLAYEASLKGWLPSIVGTDHIASNQFFDNLRSAGVSFYNAANVTLSPPHTPSPAWGAGGGGFMSGA